MEVTPNPKGIHYIYFGYRDVPLGGVSIFTDLVWGIVSIYMILVEVLRSDIFFQASSEKQYKEWVCFEAWMGNPNQILVKCFPGHPDAQS